MASSTVLNELVWHFAGYMRLPPGDAYVVKVMYEGGGDAAVDAAPESTPAPSHNPLPADTLAEVHTGLAPTPRAPPPPFRDVPLLKIHDSPFHNPHPTIALHPLLPPLPAPVPGG